MEERLTSTVLQTGPSQPTRSDSQSSSDAEASGNVADGAESSSTDEPSGAPSAPCGPPMEQPSPSPHDNCAREDLPEQRTPVQPEVWHLLSAGPWHMHVCLPSASLLAF